MTSRTQILTAKQKWLKFKKIVARIIVGDDELKKHPNNSRYRFAAEKKESFAFLQ